ncbi:DUF4097 family beta strand repeat-containing protein [Actinacidiphila acidipaludis]|uniref:DUF4097 domain-containing protein n=1 Tax=Actinacidiphila acidipaludis TaxID=2873382 RepID=A0ABS7QCL7_9ACTN|nr:DUF4097 family beta strand repeat-containing protein [Streptomyces acidipaludis]MBY8880915.1 DUF4097 domain-containing protein [Streptomyces acidipaludis]
MQTFKTPAPIAVVLDVPAGRVRLVAGERAVTTVEVRPADASKSRDARAAEEYEVTYADGVLRVGPGAARHRVLGGSGSVEVTVHLPAGSRLDAKVAAAELRGEGRLGDVTVDGRQAGVDLDEAAGARVTVLAGDVSVGRLGGPAEISTQKGDLRIAEAVRGAVVLRTGHGDIEVGAATGVSASLDAGTAHGRIHNALKNAEGAAADLTVQATTAYGDVTARSL